MPSRKVTGPVLGITGILLFLLAWELTPRLGIVQERFLPPASTVLKTLVDYLGQPAFWGDVGETMLAWTIGLGVSVVSAVILGLLIGSSSFLSKATYTTIEFLRPIPSVALIPLAVLLLGVKIESSLLLIIYASFWQVLLQVLYGVADVDPVADNTARSYGLGLFARARYVVWPTVLPYLMTGIRLASAVALILAITAELVIGSPGLGYQIALTQSGGAVPEMYALIVATGVIGIIINLVMRFLERKLLSWHSSIRSEVVA
ncbi:ABC transporter permease [Leifsonella bigeumensis]|uniref:ABC transporter permease n=1 Tax=Leifsonella bigeumensis TaxID=433643 RepID=UPI003CD09362